MNASPIITGPTSEPVEFQPLPEPPQPPPMNRRQRRVAQAAKRGKKITDARPHRVNKESRSGQMKWRFW